jgi:hypothetical protein
MQGGLLAGEQMIALPELVKLLESETGPLEPSLRQFVGLLVEVFNKLDDDLLNQNVPEQERRAIQQTVLKALECHTQGLPPPSEEIRFWMKLLDRIVLLPEEPSIQ